MRAGRGIATWCLAIPLAWTGTAHAQAPAPGATLATAIALPARTEKEGVDAEYAYVKKNFPGWTLGSDGLLADKGKEYDTLQLVGPNGAKKTVIFDITAWFGK